MATELTGSLILAGSTSPHAEIANTMMMPVFKSNLRALSALTAGFGVNYISWEVLCATNVLTKTSTGHR